MSESWRWPGTVRARSRAVGPSVAHAGNLSSTGAAKVRHNDEGKATRTVARIGGLERCLWDPGAQPPPNDQEAAGEASGLLAFAFCLGDCRAPHGDTVVTSITTGFGAAQGQGPASARLPGRSSL